MKTVLQELIERLEEKIKICTRNNLEREAMGMIEAKAIATELLEKEREQIIDSYESALIKMGTATNERQYAEQYYNETFNQNQLK